ncbi:MAG: 2-oxoacid:acceptor oxidoreductase subunit alpha [Oligoflexia bacterium]|nr:2-oxoacid:acceptor oxidoreductase subunit alpha [Oligoflexia bacterium]
MKAKLDGVLTGVHYMDGDQAACEGALAAGCRYIAGYPITPSTETVERFAQRIPCVGGIFMQMEDEIASSIAIQGAVWGGAKAMTVTSGPGFSLMMEHIGYAIMTETPCVFVDVQRGGPSTGLPTMPSQSDLMQARWGSHGDYDLIALCPNSPQECFDLMICAFNFSERFRIPVMFMMDECIGHMTEKVVIPHPDDIEITPRRYTAKRPQDYLLYGPCDDLVPEMPEIGKGYHFHITGLTHDERGYPDMTVDAQHRLIHRLIHKIKNYKNGIVMVEADDLDNAEVVVLSFGITSRIADRAIIDAKNSGIKTGKIRLKTIWPFPDELVKNVSQKARAIVVPEINAGQIVREVERAATDRCRIISVPHYGGGVHRVETIYDAIIEGAKVE